MSGRRIKALFIKIIILSFFVRQKTYKAVFGVTQVTKS